MYIRTFTDTDPEMLDKLLNKCINCSDDYKNSQYKDELQREQQKHSQDISPELNLESFKRISQAPKTSHSNKKRNIPVNTSTGMHVHNIYVCICSYYMNNFKPGLHHLQAGVRGKSVCQENVSGEHIFLGNAVQLDSIYCLPQEQVSS